MWLSVVRFVSSTGKERSWICGSFTEREHDRGAIELPAINCTLPIAEVYEDLPSAST